MKGLNVEKKKCGECYWCEIIGRYKCPAVCHHSSTDKTITRNCLACHNFITPEDYEKQETKSAEQMFVGTKEEATEIAKFCKAIIDDTIKEESPKLLAPLAKYIINIIKQHRFVFTIGKGEGIAKGFTCEPDENFVLHCYGKTAEESLGVAAETLHEGDHVIYEPETGLIHKLPVPPENFRGHT